MNTTTWALVGGLVLAGGAAAIYSDGEEPVPTPDTALAPNEAPTGEAGAVAPNGGGIGGTVAEVLQVDSYTYVRLEDGTWAAVPKTELAVGDRVAIADATLMRGFESKTLGRKFDAIYFGTLASEGGAMAGSELPAGHPPLGADPHGRMPSGHGGPTATPPSDVSVPRAEGGVTVAELYSKAAELEGTKVTFAGRVIKVTPEVLGKTWLHVQDGTGDANAKTNDIVVTTQAVPAVGDTVTLTGTLVRNKDLGSGYRYDVLVEDAALTTPL